MVSADEPAGQLAFAPRASSSLVVRQFFYDWDTESRPGSPSNASSRSRPAPPGADVADAAAVARQLPALGGFVDEAWLSGTTSRGWAAPRAQCVSPPARTDMGGAAENVTVWGSWELAEDEALLIEVTPPRRCTGASLSGPLVEDHRLRRPSVQPQRPSGVLDDDGVFGPSWRTATRASPTGSTRPATPGGQIVRYVRADPLPSRSPLWCPSATSTTSAARHRSVGAAGGPR